MEGLGYPEELEAVVTDFGVISPEGKLKDFKSERRDEPTSFYTATAGWLFENEVRIDSCFQQKDNTMVMYL